MALKGIEFVKNYEEKIGNDMKADNGTGSDYLPWGVAWARFKEKYPDGAFKIQYFDVPVSIESSNADGEVVSKVVMVKQPYYNDSLLGYMVSTSISCDGINYGEPMVLPVMDSKAKSMKDHAYKYSTKNGNKDVSSAVMTDINRAIMRCLVKTIAIQTGIGLQFWIKEEQKLYLDPVISSDDLDDLKDRIDVLGVSKKFLIDQINKKFGVEIYDLSEVKDSQLKWVNHSLDIIEAKARKPASKPASKEVPKASKKAASNQEKFDIPDFVKEAAG